MKYGLPPIERGDARLLILGSLPGEISLNMQQYYAHPQNKFWRIISELVGEEMPTEYAQRCDMLIRHRIALWDVIHYAEREGSLDADIKNPMPNDFDTFFAQHPDIRMIILNGGKAASLYRKHFKHIGIATVQVPSTSPARANMNYEQKLSAWREAVPDYL